MFCEQENPRNSKANVIVNIENFTAVCLYPLIRKKMAELANSPTKAYHLIQAFTPDEVSFEKAHRIGKELAD